MSTDENVFLESCFWKFWGMFWLAAVISNWQDYLATHNFHKWKTNKTFKTMLKLPKIWDLPLPQWADCCHHQAGHQPDHWAGNPSLWLAEVSLECWTLIGWCLQELANLIDWWAEGVILPSICAVGIIGRFIDRVIICSSHQQYLIFPLERGEYDSFVVWFNSFFEVGSDF